MRVSCSSVLKLCDKSTLAHASTFRKNRLTLRRLVDCFVKTIWAQGPYYGVLQRNDQCNQWREW